VNVKTTEIPNKAWGALSTQIPTKVVYDWEAFLAILKKKKFVIIESAEIRMTKKGVEECIPVKAFNAFVRNSKGKQLRTKRLSQTRWFCTL